MIFANDRFYEIFGYNREEYRERVKDDRYALIYEADRSIYLNFLKTKREQGQEAMICFRIVRKDGEIAWIRVNITKTSLYGIDDPVEVSLITDITNEKEAVDQLQFLNQSAHDILEQADAEYAVNMTLQKILNYFVGDRTYIFEMDSDKKITKNSFECCADGISHEIDRLQNISYNESVFWYNLLLNGENVYVKDAASLPDEDRSTRELLLMQGIHSAIFTPLTREGKLIGFVGVDNPRLTGNHLNRLNALGDYIAILLTRRDLNKKIEQDSKAIRILMADTPGGFCKMRIRRDGFAEILYANEGFCNMMKMDYEEIQNLYGSNAFLYLHSDDLDHVRADARGALFDQGRFNTRCRLRTKEGEYTKIMIFGRFAKADDKEFYMNSYFVELSEHAKHQN